MNGYRHRRIEQSVLEALDFTPIVLISGARQVGKSTLAAHIGQERNAISYNLDDHDVREVVAQDPKGFARQAPDRLVVLDEVQRSPELILALKSAVDADRKPGRFLLTGSADLSAVKGVGDSLAGRVENIELGPFSVGEATRIPHEDFVSRYLAGELRPQREPLDPDVVLAGGFPVPLNLPEKNRRRWYHSYISALATHDAPELAEGGFSDHIEQLIRRIAAAGQAELVPAQLAQEFGISHATVDKYLSLLDAMHLITQVKPWGRSVLGRETKKKKVGLVDTGLAASLVGFGVEKIYRPGGREYWGALVEQFVANELKKQRAWSSTEYSVFHYRSAFGEIDLVLELLDGSCILIEVKSGQTIRSDSFAGIEKAAAKLGSAVRGKIVMHGGETCVASGMASGVEGADRPVDVLPINALWN